MLNSTSSAIISFIQFACAQFFKCIEGTITPIVLNLGFGLVPDFRAELNPVTTLESEEGFDCVSLFLLTRGQECCEKGVVRFKERD